MRRPRIIAGRTKIVVAPIIEAPAIVPADVQVPAPITRDVYYEGSPWRVWFRHNEYFNFESYEDALQEIRSPTFGVHLGMVGHIEHYSTVMGWYRHAEYTAPSRRERPTPVKETGLLTHICTRYTTWVMILLGVSYLMQLIIRFM